MMQDEFFIEILENLVPWRGIGRNKAGPRMVFRIHLNYALGFL
jgi:hypothetical protein